MIFPLDIRPRVLDERNGDLASLTLWNREDEIVRVGFIVFGFATHGALFTLI